MNKYLRTIIIIAIILWTAGVSFIIESQEAEQIIPSRLRLKNPEIWLCPMSPDLAERSSEWNFVRTRLSGVQFYIDGLSKMPMEELLKLAVFVKQEGLKVSIECGGTLNADWQDEAGERSAQVELAKMDKWYKAGGRVDYLNLDGPIRRLLGFEGWNKGEPFTSVERCVKELVDYLKVVKKAHPEIRFFLLTNFPNWGYRGEVSYHARGRNRQEYGDYDTVIKIVLDKVQEAGLRIEAVTVDNPYEYLVGEHMSVNLRNPKTIDWVARVRALEDFVKAKGLEFNLIINSEYGGHTSDREFYERTLKMIDVYTKRGGRPDRYFVQSWYLHPKTYIPEATSYSMTALVKAVILKLHPEK